MVERLNRFADGFERHWLAVLVGILLTYSLLPFGAPILKWLGLDGLAQAIYQPYKLMCHTYGFRSFFLFGERFVYDRAEFERVSGIDTGTFAGLLQARDFQGNAQMGYKVALCQRDVAIYFAMGVNGIAYALVRRRARPIPWLVFVLIGVLPIGLDGFSQLLSQPPFNLFAYRESNWVLRLATGGLFGFSLAWLVFPLIEGAFRPARSKPHTVAGSE
ncbi:MAG: DUF2085 domain-containing protein [Anaerolineae bacterium]|jgi:uncharacterized membrane protein|nr:DUF2085 domain-containing protein [Anaerolineae bacterium]